MNGGGLQGTRWRACALAAVTSIAFALPVAADVTHVTVRFRDAAAGITSPADLGRLQAMAAALRTGIGEVAVTRDGAYRVALAPALSDDGARAALARLRMERAVLYAEAVRPRHGAPRQPRAKLDTRSPRLARIIVKFRDPRLAADAAADRPLSDTRVSQLSARAGRPLAFGRTMSWAGVHLLHLLRKAPQDEVEAIAAAIAQDPDVEWAEPDILMFPHRVPSDPLYAQQWHYMAPGAAAGGANLPSAWDRTTGWSGIRIAVLDTGALLAHPDLAMRFIGGYDFIYDWVTGNDNDPPPAAPCFANPLAAGCDNRDASAADPGDWISPEDDAGVTFGGWLNGCGIDASSWHGSHVAGTIGAQSDNASGVAGVNWTSRIVPVRVLGKCGGYNSDIADGVVWAAGGTVSGVPDNPLPARVLNLSLGGNGACSATFQNAINAALARDAVVVISAGNENGDAAGASPGNCNGVVTVAAVGRVGQRASYSNYGTTVEIAAPGGSDGDRVLSTLNAGMTVPAAMNYVGYNGTSMAAPHVAGVASLLLSLKPSLTPAQVTTILQAQVRPFPSGTIARLHEHRWQRGRRRAVLRRGDARREPRAGERGHDRRPGKHAASDLHHHGRLRAEPLVRGRKRDVAGHGDRHVADRHGDVHAGRRAARRMRRSSALGDGQREDRPVHDDGARCGRADGSRGVCRRRGSPAFRRRARLAHGAECDAAADHHGVVEQPQSIGARRGGHADRDSHRNRPHRLASLSRQRRHDRRLRHGRAHRCGEQPQRPVHDLGAAGRQQRARGRLWRRRRQPPVDGDALPGRDRPGRVHQLQRRPRLEPVLHARAVVVQPRRSRSAAPQSSTARTTRSRAWRWRRSCGGKAMRSRRST